MQPFEFSAAAKAKEVMRCPRCCTSPLSLYSCLIYAFHRRRQGCRGCWERRNRREIRGSPSFVKGGKRQDTAGWRDTAGSGGKWQDMREVAGSGETYQDVSIFSGAGESS